MSAASGRQLDGASTDWIVVRQPLSDDRLAQHSSWWPTVLIRFALRLGFRSIDGFAERVVYRDFSARALTALDDLDEATSHAPSMGHVTRARGSDSLLRQLKLPLERARPSARRNRAGMVSPRSTSRSNSTTSSAPEGARIIGALSTATSARS